MSVIIAPGIPSMQAGTYNTAQDAYNSKPGPGSSGSGMSYQIGSGISAAANNLSSQIAQNYGVQANNLASQIAAIAGNDISDYGDYIRQALTLSQQNTAQSQQFAREQMAYQQQSDANAMAWSASEADKNRQWQERLSNQAHQREVQDLIAAGLNPILAANNGAYTGSGATGQAFSSSGAQGQVDTSASGIMGSIADAIINTASQASIAKMYNDTSKYTADMQYAASKLAADTQIYNEHSRNEANKILTAMNNQADIAKANIGAGATVSAAGASAAAIRDAAMIQAEASKYNSDNTRFYNMYATDENNKTKLITNKLDNATSVHNSRRQYEASVFPVTHNRPYEQTKTIVGEMYDAIVDAFNGNQSQSGGSGRKF